MSATLDVQNLHTLDLEPYQYSGVNFTGLRLVDVDNPDVQSTYDEYLSEMNLESIMQLSTEAALMYDAVQFFAKAFNSFRYIADGQVKKLPCDGSENWDFGASFSNHMRTVSMRMARFKKRRNGTFKKESLISSKK